MVKSTISEIIPIRSLSDLVGPSLSLIPVVGGSLAALYSQWDTDRRFKRVQETLDELARLLASTKHRLATGQLNDEDMQILEMALQQAQMAHTVRKRLLFARLVASAWTDSRDRPFDERAVFVEALSAFTEQHLKVLARLHDSGVDGTITYTALCDDVLLEIPAGVERDSIMIPVLETLAARFGMVRRAWGLNDPKYDGTVLISRNLSPEGIARKCSHAITPLGERFMASLEEDKAV